MAHHPDKPPFSAARNLRERSHMTETNLAAGVSRRDILAGGSLALAATGAASAAPAQSPATPAVGGLGGGGAASEVFAVADTSHGKVQGIVNAGVREFKGVP